MGICILDQAEHKSHYQAPSRGPKWFLGDVRVFNLDDYHGALSEVLMNKLACIYVRGYTIDH